MSFLRASYHTSNKLRQFFIFNLTCSIAVVDSREENMSYQTASIPSILLARRQGDIASSVAILDDDFGSIGTTYQVADTSSSSHLTCGRTVGNTAKIIKTSPDITT